MSGRVAAMGALEDRYVERNPKSRELFERHRSATPGGFAKGAYYFAPFPVAMERGDGCFLWDVDGHRVRRLRQPSHRAGAGPQPSGGGGGGAAAARTRRCARCAGRGRDRAVRGAVPARRLPGAGALLQLRHRGDPARGAPGARLHRQAPDRQVRGLLPRQPRRGRDQREPTAGPGRSRRRADPLCPGARHVPRRAGRGGDPAAAPPPPRSGASCGRTRTSWRASCSSRAPASWSCRRSSCARCARSPATAGCRSSSTRSWPFAWPTAARNSTTRSIPTSPPSARSWAGGFPVGAFGGRAELMDLLDPRPRARQWTERHLQRPSGHHGGGAGDPARPDPGSGRPPQRPRRAAGARSQRDVRAALVRRRGIQRRVGVRCLLHRRRRATAPTAPRPGRISNPPAACSCHCWSRATICRRG